MSDFSSGFNPYDFIARLQQMQAASGILQDVVGSPPEKSQETLAVDRRAARLKAAGMIHPKAVAAAVASVGRCPVVAGNAASLRIAREVESFVGTDLQTLVLIAAPGRGKSFAAAWAIAEHQSESMWLQALDVRVGASWDSLRERAVKVPMLVVDDLGEEAAGEYGVKEIAGLLQSRHNCGLKTLVTTNLLEDEIHEKYGERLTSRWSEEGLSRVVMVDGPDLRQMRR